MYPCPTTEEVKIYFLMVAEVVDHYRISSIFKSSECRERCLSVPGEFDVIHGFGMPRAAFPMTEDGKVHFFVETGCRGRQLLHDLIMIKEPTRRLALYWGLKSLCDY